MITRLEGRFVTGMEDADPSEAMAIVLRDDRISLELHNLKPVEYAKPLNTIRYFAIEDGGTTTNVAAVAAFGVFGLGARRKWTSITIGYPQGDVVVAVREPIPSVRATLRSAVERNPSLAGILVEGPPPPLSDFAAPDPGRAESSDPLDQLERLVVLHERGAIDSGEFTRLKRALIDGL